MLLAGCIKYMQASVCFLVELLEASHISLKCCSSFWFQIQACEMVCSMSTRNMARWQQCRLSMRVIIATPWSASESTLPTPSCFLLLNTGKVEFSLYKAVSCVVFEILHLNWQRMERNGKYWSLLTCGEISVMYGPLTALFLQTHFGWQWWWWW